MEKTYFNTDIHIEVTYHYENIKNKKILLIILYFKTHRKFNLNYSRKQVEIFSLRLSSIIKSIVLSVVSINFNRNV